MARCLKAMRVSCIECTARRRRARARWALRWSQLDRAGAWSGRRLYGPRSRRSPPPSYRLGRGVLGRRSIILVCGGSCSNGLGRLDRARAAREAPRSNAHPPPRCAPLRARGGSNARKHGCARRPWVVAVWGSSGAPRAARRLTEFRCSVSRVSRKSAGLGSRMEEDGSARTGAAQANAAVQGGGSGAMHLGRARVGR